LGMRAPRSTRSADRISSCAIIMAGVVGGVLVFVVALPLALSSPFPTPKQGEWVIQNAAFDGASPSATSLLVPPPMEPLPVEALPEEATMVTASLGDAQAAPDPKPEPVAFSQRWDLTVPPANVATPSAPPAIEVAPEATRMTPPAEAAAPKHRDAARDPVEQYLWEVYQRKSVKSDSTGDFTWKDPAAAKRLGMSLQTYVIGGMDPDFREQLFHAGHAMDSSGLRWTMLSAFRDDYRQGLASGFKAHGGNSLHGGSRATGGYGHGRAIDITTAEGEASAVWHWIDAHGGRFGLRRPMPGIDPAHIQPQNAYHDLAHQLREARNRLANEMNGTVAVAEPAIAKMKVASLSEGHEGRRHRR
jgi:hypothetical protein